VIAAGSPGEQKEGPMIHALPRHVLSVIVLALCAGTTTTLAQTRAEPIVVDANAATPALDFRSNRWMCERAVVNDNAEVIGKVSDLVLDRGSGRIEYVIVRSGSSFGMGGRDVAIPFGAFRWERGGSNRFVLAATPEQIKEFPEYTPERWKNIGEEARDENNPLHRRLAADAAAPSDPYASDLETADSIRVEGEITRVERIRSSSFGEQVVITVAPTSGAARRIALGPSWYVNGAAAAPMRGDKVVVDTLALPRDPDKLLAAAHLRNGDHELRLRETNGAPAWTLKTIESSGRKYPTAYSRYVVLSHLMGMKVDCRGKETGKIHDIILERRSGTIGFVSIDPNQNFLGVGDTKRLLPWSVATLTLDNTVRIDASKEMVLASPETPTDLSTLNTGDNADNVYKAYDVPTPAFEVLPAQSASGRQPEEAWAANGAVIKSIEPGSARIIEGKVVSLSEFALGNSDQPAQALTIRSMGDNGREELVLLGPAGYMRNQKLICKEGDTVKADACRTTIDGRTYWIARSVECKDVRIVLLDERNIPAWTSR
jgi:sporulation protein YlmC with PRC-barrel domain